MFAKIILILITCIFEYISNGLHYTSHDEREYKLLISILKNLITQLLNKPSRLTSINKQNTYLSHGKLSLVTLPVSWDALLDLRQAKKNHAKTSTNIQNYK